jgi:hypothetical protein
MVESRRIVLNRKKKLHQDPLALSDYPSEAWQPLPQRKCYSIYIHMVESRRIVLNRKKKELHQDPLALSRQALQQRLFLQTCYSIYMGSSISLSKYSMAAIAT